MGKPIDIVGGGSSQPNWTWDGVSVDIASHTQANPYVVPNDGYLLIVAPAGKVAEANTEDTAIPMEAVAAGLTSGAVYTTFFLKKGMKVYPSTKPTGSSFVFRGLTTY